MPDIMQNPFFHFENTVPLHLGSLTAQNAKFCLAVFKTLQKKLNLSKEDLKNKTFLLAVSGGIDSIVMLAIFAGCQQYFGYTLHIAHFNHGIRKESHDEEKLLATVCKRLALPYTIERANTPEYAKQNKIGLEEAGRILRYDFFSRLQHEMKNCLLCTAHHADDLCEDVLMRLIRGTAWPRLAGMDYYDEKRKLLRPLLYFKKQELTDFLQDLGIPHAEDGSNADNTFLRNRIRHNLIPLLETENPHFYKNILKLKQNAEYDRIHFQNEINKIMENAYTEDSTIIVPLEYLQRADKCIRLHCYHALLKQIKHGHGITENFERLDNALMKNHGKTEFQFSGHARMKIRQNALYCYIETE